LTCVILALALYNPIAWSRILGAAVQAAQQEETHKQQEKNNSGLVRIGSHPHDNGPALEKVLHEIVEEKRDDAQQEEKNNNGLVHIGSHPRDDGPALEKVLPEIEQEKHDDDDDDDFGKQYLPENAADAQSLRDHYMSSTHTLPENADWGSVDPLPGKKGVGSITENIPWIDRLNVYWNYSWKAERDAAQPMNVEFLPMVWGYWTAAYLENTLETVVRPQFDAGTAKRLLLINEPDIRSESNVSAATVFDKVWPSVSSAHKNHWPLSSPNVANPKGDWMVEFMTRVDETGARVDFIAFHSYVQPGAKFEHFARHIVDVYEFHGAQRPLLITELGCPHWTISTMEENEWDPADVLAFAKEALPWLEAQEFILGYAWFPFPINFPKGWSSALWDLDGNLTPLGEYYASVTNENPKGDQTIQIL